MEVTGLRCGRASVDGARQIPRAVKVARPGPNWDVPAGRLPMATGVTLRESRKRRTRAFFGPWRGESDPRNRPPTRFGRQEIGDFETRTEPQIIDRRGRDMIIVGTTPEGVRALERVPLRTQVPRHRSRDADAGSQTRPSARGEARRRALIAPQLVSTIGLTVQTRGEHSSPSAMNLPPSSRHIRPAGACETLCHLRRPQGSMSIDRRCIVVAQRRSTTICAPSTRVLASASSHNRRK